MPAPRILFIDIETSPIIAAVWNLYEANAIYVLRDTYILSVAYKWLGEKQAKSKSLPDFPRYKKHKHCDRELCRFLWKLLDEANIVVAHNGKKFDIKKINSRLLVHKCKPYSQIKIVDTLVEARRTFAFDSNKQDNISRYLGGPRKLKNPEGLWERCSGDKYDRAAWEQMAAYNRRDVDGLEVNYDFLKGWMPNHPNLNLYNGSSSCPTCQSSRVTRRGMNYGKSVVRQRMLCLDCGASHSGAIVHAQASDPLETREIKAPSKLRPGRRHRRRVI